MHITNQPIGEVGECMLCDVARKQFVDVTITADDVDYGLRLFRLVYRLAVVESVHALISLVNVKVEGRVPAFVGIDQAPEQLPLRRRW